MRPTTWIKAAPIVPSSVTIDWTLRENVRAQLRVPRGRVLGTGLLNRAVGRHAAGHTAVRETGVTEYSIGTAASVRFEVERPDDVAPLLNFLGDKLAEIGR